MEIDPVISVCMITYRHEEFIAQAIETILMQETSFQFELVIANDASPDKTDSIIETIIATHPKGKLIKYFKHENNIGMMANFGFALSNCKGKYIALCEGDDYWSTNNKLQIQFDFLERNSDFSLIGHNAKFNRDGKEIDKLVRRIDATFIDITTSDLIQRNPFVTCGVMFKNIGFENIMSILNNFVVGDKAVYTLVSFHGKCRFYAQPLGYYRKHEHSVTSKNRIDYKPYKRELINRIKHAEYWNVYSNGKYSAECQIVKESRSRVLSNIAFLNLDIKTAIHYSQFVDMKKINKLHSKIILKSLQIMARYIG